MTASEPLGYLASLLVLATFCTRGMVELRAVAIASNLAFIAYGLLAGIHPVLILHMALLPTNAYRLIQALRSERRLVASPPLQTPSAHPDAPRTTLAHLTPEKRLTNDPP